MHHPRRWFSEKTMETSEITRVNTAPTTLTPSQTHLLISTQSTSNTPQENECPTIPIPSQTVQPISTQSTSSTQQ